MNVLRFAVFETATGRIDRIISCPSGCVVDSLGANEDALAVTTETDATHYVEGNALVPFPVRPSQLHRWDWTTMAWVLPLAAARAAKWREIKAARDAMEFGGFSVGGLAYDSDEISRGRITGAVSLAIIAQTSGTAFAQDWTLANNDSVLLDADGMVAVGVALGQHVAAAHAHAKALRAAINSATTTAAVAEITWGTP